MRFLTERILAAVDAGEMMEFREEGLEKISSLTFADTLKPYEDFFNVASIAEGFAHATVRRSPSFEPQVKRSKLPIPVRSPILPAPASKGNRDAWTGLSAMVAFCLEQGVDLRLDQRLKEADLGEFITSLATCISDWDLFVEWWLESCLTEINSFFELGQVAIPLPFYSFSDDEHDGCKINFLYGPQAVASEIELLVDENVLSLSDDVLSVIDMVGGLQALVELYANSPLPKWVDLKALWEERELDRLMERYPEFSRPYLCADYPVDMEILSVESLRFCRDYYSFFEKFDAQNPGGWVFRQNEENSAGLFVAHMVEVVQATLLPCPLDCTTQNKKEPFYAAAA